MATSENLQAVSVTADPPAECEFSHLPPFTGYWLLLGGQHRSWLWAALAIRLVWSHQNKAWSQKRKNMHLPLCTLSEEKVRRGAVGQQFTLSQQTVVCRRKPQDDSELPGEQVHASVCATTTNTHSRCLQKPSDWRSRYTEMSLFCSNVHFFLKGNTHQTSNWSWKPVYFLYYAWFQLVDQTTQG